MNINYDNASEEVRVELIPLIDVIFCILTFFILAAVSLTRQQAIGVDLPQATTASPQMRDMLIVSVDYIGQVYVEEQAIQPDQLVPILQQYQQQVPEGMMVLYASQDARYADVVTVLDVLRSVGGDRAALATVPPTPADSRLPGLDAPTIPTDPLGNPPGFNPGGSGSFDDGLLAPTPTLPGSGLEGGSGLDGLDSAPVPLPGAENPESDN